ncbi:unnamed protein product [Clavelina lepadiformis]|uniref:Uncharacterized protein n=1 Tax=Clavelina lepadiformis TaxID=159417 RepID=A0ABP0F075_CLALP
MNVMSEDKNKACLIACVGSETSELHENLLVDEHVADKPFTEVTGNYLCTYKDTIHFQTNAIISATLVSKLERSSSNTLLTLTFNINVCWNRILPCKTSSRKPKPTTKQCVRIKC